MEDVDVAIQMEARLTEREFRSLVCGVCGYSISRSRLFELRWELGIDSDAFTPEGARVMAYYAKLRRRRVPPDKAKEQTIQFAKENGL